MSARTMKQDWDARARKDAFFYIASWKEGWTPREFLGSGEADYLGLVQPVLAEFHFEPATKTMLELGCGMGRMTHPFAGRFRHVVAVDVSPEMLRKGQELLRGVPNITWLLGNGHDLAMVRNAGVDFVFSYIVLQHVPSRELVLSYVREMVRVLVPGGLFLFQFNSHRGATMNWKGRAVWATMDRLREPVLGIPMGKVSGFLARLLGLDPHLAGRTWRGAVVEVRDVLEAVWSSGGAVFRVANWGTPMTWCVGQKVSTNAGMP
jgi:SAM-dependent methyltransferase